MRSNPKTIFEKILAELLPIYDTGEARAIASLLLEDLLGLNKADIVAEKQLSITDTQNRQLWNALDRLKKDEPIQYVLEKSDFYGHQFKVNPDVLIPRQETEELVDWIIQEGHDTYQLLDIGTGSGCIAISLAFGYPNSKVAAWDISEIALNVAAENPVAIATEFIFKKVDILTELPNEKFDLIVSNPPYVLESEKSTMNKNVLAYEPKTALFVEDHGPLVFYRRISNIASEILLPGGWLYFEINETYANSVISLMEKSGLINVESKKDLNGKDRMVRGKRPD